jgi:hypothetical protein
MHALPPQTLGVFSIWAASSFSIVVLPGLEFGGYRQL